jgi:phage anti-repressor protein
MEDFLYKFSTLPKDFIKDFFIVAKEEYEDNEIIIDFEIVCKWLKVFKENLKKILLKNFEELYDYTIEKKQKKQINSTGKTTYYEILITPNCFKEICMISQTDKAKEVRKYFIEMEKLIKKYVKTS